MIESWSWLDINHRFSSKRAFILADFCLLFKQIRLSGLRQTKNKIFQRQADFDICALLLGKANSNPPSGTTYLRIRPFLWLFSPKNDLQSVPD